jgi:hypothetical protein
LEAVTGRKVFYYSELRRLILAENIVKAFYDRAKAKDWAKWTQENPVLADLLFEAEKLWQATAMLG